jgi:hypothetical protein
MQTLNAGSRKSILRIVQIFKAILVILFTLFCLTCNGQYQKILRGQPSPYDTGVVIRIDRYRSEGLKLKLYPVLVDSLNLEIGSLHKEIVLGDSVNRLLIFQNHILAKSVDRKDSVNHILNQNFNTLYNQSTKPWWKKPEGIGIIVIGTLEALKLIFGK